MPYLMVPLNRSPTQQRACARGLSSVQELAASAERDAQQAERDSAALLEEQQRFRGSEEGARWAEERGRRVGLWVLGCRQATAAEGWVVGRRCSAHRRSSCSAEPGCVWGAGAGSSLTLACPLSTPALAPSVSGGGPFSSGLPACPTAGNCGDLPHLPHCGTCYFLAVALEYCGVEHI